MYNSGKNVNASSVVQETQVTDLLADGNCSELESNVPLTVLDRFFFAQNAAGLGMLIAGTDFARDPIDG